MKKGQVWIETVLYTLIGLALIGMVLTFALPKINESRDNLVIEQTVGSIRNLDNLVSNILDQGPGNKRIYEITFKKGELEINGESDKIEFFIDDLESLYSEPGVVIQEGRVNVLSEEGQKNNKVQLTLDYSGSVNITYNGEDQVKRFGAASTSYRFSVTNEREGGGELTVIDFLEVSGK